MMASWGKSTIGNFR